MSILVGKQKHNVQKPTAGGKGTTNFLKARFRFLLVRWLMSLAFARFASVPRAFGAHAVVLWQVYQYSVRLCEGRISKFETETQTIFETETKTYLRLRDAKSPEKRVFQTHKNASEIETKLSDSHNFLRKHQYTPSSGLSCY